MGGGVRQNKWDGNWEFRGRNCNKMGWDMKEKGTGNWEKRARN